MTRRTVLSSLIAAAGTLVSKLASAGPRSPDAPAATHEHHKRSRVLYVIIDRPADATFVDHRPNFHGVSRSVEAFDKTLEVTAVTVDELLGLDAAGLDARYHPLAIFGAGSFSEWYLYGVDSGWRERLDNYMTILRTTIVPTLAVCGSHQLTAFAFNGPAAVAHMTDVGAPITIAEELGLATPRGLWPHPRVGEEGNYPLVATAAGSADPLVQASSAAPRPASHHKDMVVDTRGFTLLYQPDFSREPATNADEQVTARCTVQAMKRDDRSRILYTTQFHPEMSEFNESTSNDDGFGAAFLGAFLRQAKQFWAAREADEDRRMGTIPETSRTATPSLVPGRAGTDDK